jgi:hypothetical protein
VGNGPHATRSGPENDGTDGRVITVGDVSLQIITMPGRTAGTISFLFEFKNKENGTPIRVAYPGGTAIDFDGTAAEYDEYIASARNSPRRQRTTAPPRCCRITSSSTTPSSRRMRRRTPGKVAGVENRRWGRPIRITSVNGRGRALRHGSQAPFDWQPLN